MGELWFIGAGLCDERDLSGRALSILAGCARVFAEEYTAILAPSSLERLGEKLGRRIERLSREAVEGGTEVLAALGASERVALLVPGDPFAATTHVALRLACERAGHAWRYLPNASVLTAAPAFLGLMLYRFGRIVSLPFPEPGFAPSSPLEMIERNRAADLHTLVLLDLRPSEGRFLTAREAIDLLLTRDPAGRAVPPDAPLGVVARVGSESAAAWWGRPRQLLAVDFGPPLHALVIPAPRLHFEEEAAVARFSVGTD